MMMEASFDTEESFDDPSCLAPQPPGSVSPAKRQITEVKETKITINCVTFPLPGEGPEQQLLKPNEWSYCDYFWADRKDPQGAAHVTGFEVLLQKQLKGKQLQKEMAEFIHERIKIEEEYAKNLSKLSLSPLAAQEEGTLGEAWTQLKKSLHDEAEVHLKFSNKLHTDVEKPLLTFRGDNFKKDLKKYDHHIADLRKQLASRFAGEGNQQAAASGGSLLAARLAAGCAARCWLRGSLLAARLAAGCAARCWLRGSLLARRLEEKSLSSLCPACVGSAEKLAERSSTGVCVLCVCVLCVCVCVCACVCACVCVSQARKALADRQKDLEVKTQQLEIKLSNKTEEDIKKARRKSTQAGDDLMRCLDLYNQTQSKWFEEMVTTSMELEKLEVERVEWVQQHLRQYTTLRHETDMFNQSTVEPVDQLLQSMDPAKDRELWVKENKTGEVRPVDLDI
ncbi:growth arrest-specific protein 7a [Poeciliopsis prolifica]|uniref:growth arrest-specific protein 7a n=1 Tax=Poeciliopsis prolifica TaxID=188132 RepID=UPI002413C05C|nr:growth arrest-specific protein 7a [Poeciliopsis prolifica]